MHAAIKSPASIMMVSVVVMTSESAVVHLRSHVDLVVASLSFHRTVLVLVGSVSHLGVSLTNFPFAHVDIRHALPEISVHYLIHSLLFLINTHVSLHVALAHLKSSHILVHLALVDILSPLELKPSSDISLHAVAHVALHSHVALHAVTLVIALIVALVVALVAVEVARIHRSILFNTSIKHQWI